MCFLCCGKKKTQEDSNLFLKSYCSRVKAYILRCQNQGNACKRSIYCWGVHFTQVLIHVSNTDSHHKFSLWRRVFISNLILPLIFHKKRKGLQVLFRLDCMTCLKENQTGKCSCLKGQYNINKARSPGKIVCALYLSL